MVVRFLASLTLCVAVSVLVALLLVVPSHHGLDAWRALLSLGSGLIAAGTYCVQATLPAWRHDPDQPAWHGARLSVWDCLMFAAFGCFGVGMFCWLVYHVGDEIRIGSPNNLGDLSLHTLLANYFANGVAWWPGHPQDAFESMRYYPGVDLFQSLLTLMGADEYCALTWVDLVGTAATALALRLWGGSFTMAGFLFSGGLAGFAILRTGVFADYQATLAWKSLPLAIFVTQRSFLFALPAGLLLLAHWRAKYFSPPVPLLLGRAGDTTPEASPRGLIPLWVEVVLYAAMPVMHLFTFLFLSCLLGWWLVAYCLRRPMFWQLLTLVAAAVAPATWQIDLMTGFKGGQLHLKWSWMCPPDQNYLWFWVLNFGLFAPLAVALWLRCAWRPVRAILLEDDLAATAAPVGSLDDAGSQAAEAFVIPAGLVFALTAVVMLTVWEWDNTKVMLWCYLAALPFIWQSWIAPLRSAARLPVCTVLFFSGFVSLIGGMQADHGVGYGLISRSELDPVSVAVAPLPIEARFAAAPDYNHPLVFCGRKLAMGYTGHLYSQGLDYKKLEADMRALMTGQPEWGQCAGRLGVRYLYWGEREEKAFPGSSKPWETRCQLVAKGTWGSLYDLQQSPAPK